MSRSAPVPGRSNVAMPPATDWQKRIANGISLRPGTAALLHLTLST